MAATVKKAIKVKRGKKRYVKKKSISNVNKTRVSIKSGTCGCHSAVPVLGGGGGGAGGAAGSTTIVLPPTVAQAVPMPNAGVSDDNITQLDAILQGLRGLEARGPLSRPGSMVQSPYDRVPRFVYDDDNVSDISEAQMSIGTLQRQPRREEPEPVLQPPPMPINVVQQEPPQQGIAQVQPFQQPQQRQNMLEGNVREVQTPRNPAQIRPREEMMAIEAENDNEIAVNLPEGIFRVPRVVMQDDPNDAQARRRQEVRDRYIQRDVLRPAPLQIEGGVENRMVVARPPENRMIPAAPYPPNFPRQI